jgi:hypothetical protein
MLPEHSRPLDVGDYVRYNGHIAQVTESRTDRSRSDWPVHTLRIEGGAIVSMLVDCDRLEVYGTRRPTIIADDPTDDGALPGETTEERITRQREASARWVQGVRDDPSAVYDVVHEGAPLEFTREGVEEWGRRQCDEITVEQEANRDYIDVTAHRDDYESVSRVSMLALHRARDPFLMLRVAAEAALGAVNGMRTAMGQATEAVEQFQTVTQNVSFSPRFLDGEGAARHLRDAVADIGISAEEAVGSMGNMTRAMRQWEMQYTNRPGVFTDLTDSDNDIRPDAEYEDDDFDFENEQRW